MKGEIISGFAGIGKTTLSRKNQDIIDLESSDFKWRYYDNETANMDKENRKGVENKEINPDWPKNYLEAIVEKVQEYRYVLISQGEDIRALLDENGIDYILAFPSVQSKTEYISRYRTRGNGEKFVNLIEKYFEQWINDLQRSPRRKIIIKQGQNLESEMRNLGLIENDLSHDER